MDFITPPGTKYARAREVQKKIPLRRGIEDTRIEKDRVGGHGQ